MRAAMLGLFVAAAAACGCTNPEVPQGHEGYVYHVPLLFGSMEYRETLRGPASTGVSWRLYVENVDMRAKSYKEDFQLLTRDNLSVSFEVNTRIKLRDGSVKEIVEQWGGEKWYEWNVKEPLRTIVREQVTRFSATDIQLETPKVRQLITEHLAGKFKATPISIESVDIGQIQFPSEVADAISRKIAKKQELERQEYVLAKTRKEAAIRVLEALKLAEQQRIISSTLDPLYVQQKAVQVYRTLAHSSNKVIMMLPNSPDATGMPSVLSSGKRKILTPADQQLLQDMERRYMKVARETPATDSPPPADSPESAESVDSPTLPAASPAPAPAPSPAPSHP
jgi:regulator of protease activity HflC (stomatin/prohibitin superfamily)